MSRISGFANTYLEEFTGLRQNLKMQSYNMVEAAGVEPASENVTGQEPTYVVAFARRELPRHIRALRLERTRNADR